MAFLQQTKKSFTIPPVTSGFSHTSSSIMQSRQKQNRRIQKSCAGAPESTAALRMPEEASRVRALYAHSKDFSWIGRSKNSSIAS
jgi:hypothetical protein